MANQNIKKNYWLIVLVLLVLAYLLYSLLLVNPMTVPEAGYCIEKNLDTSYTTFKNINGSKEAIEFCALNTFCESYTESVYLEGDNPDQTFLDDYQTTQETQGLECFQDYAPHTQRDNALFNTEVDVLKSKFVCCSINNLESSNCPGNTCEGRYMGFLDDEGCRVYANEQGFNEEGIMKITTCGGDVYSINMN